jgi:transposase
MRKNSSTKGKKQFLNANSKPETIGVDLGDRRSELCLFDNAGEVIGRVSLATTKERFTSFFGELAPCRVIIEVGTHSPWVSRLLEQLGHEVVVANAHRVKLIHKALNKNDPRDAELTGRLGRADVKLLAPLKHRGEKTQADRVLLSSRNALVETRAKLVNQIRGAVKSFGERLPGCATTAFAGRTREALPEILRLALEPLLETITDLTRRIKEYDRLLAELAEREYPETKLPRQVTGVGLLTALSFVLTIEVPGRFAKSREVGPYLGLVPRQHDSGNCTPQLRITKAGDNYLRQLLVQAAHYILGPFGPDSDLRRHGEKIAARGGKNAKKRAVVAVARKLAVLLHRLWVSGAVYDPLYTTRRAKAAATKDGGRSAEL